MTTPLVITRLHIPSAQPELVSRPRLIEQLNADLPGQSGVGATQGSARKLTLISAPAGFGKTTLITRSLGQVQTETGSNPCPCRGMNAA